MWTADVRGTLNPSRQYKKKGQITTLTFCRLPQQSANSSRKYETKASPAFFFGTDRGNLVYADDLGHCTDVQQLSSAIDIMLFHEERGRLVVITRSLLLTQYQVADDGRVSRVVQVKLSVAGDATEKGLKYVIWAGPGLLAAATHEKMLRLFDLDADENYNLSLSALGDIVARNDCVISVAFNPSDQSLAVGTLCGILAIWRNTGSGRCSMGNCAVDNGNNVTASSSADWEVTVLVL